MLSAENILCRAYDFSDRIIRAAVDRVVRRDCGSRVARQAVRGALMQLALRVALLAEWIIIQDMRMHQEEEYHA